MDIEQKIKEYEPKAKDLTFGQSSDQEYMLLKFRVWNKKHEIKISSSIFEVATAAVDKEYAEVFKNFNEEIAEATKDIKAKYEDDLNTHREKKTKVADDFVYWRIDLYFNPEEDGNEWS